MEQHLALIKKKKNPFSSLFPSQLTSSPPSLFVITAVLSASPSVSWSVLELSRPSDSSPLIQSLRPPSASPPPVIHLSPPATSPPFFLQQSALCASCNMMHVGSIWGLSLFLSLSLGWTKAQQTNYTRWVWGECVCVCLRNVSYWNECVTL